MSGGKEQFNKDYSGFGAKIDRDPAIPEELRQKFWVEIENWEVDVSGAFSEYVEKCFSSRQFCSSPVTLDHNEALGTAQPRESVIRDLTRQIVEDSEIPTATGKVIEFTINKVLNETNIVDALQVFIDEFGAYRLRSLDYGPHSRIFSFRGNPRSQDPISGHSILVLFNNLTIPGAIPSDYMMLAYTPDNHDRVNEPTCFDAGLKNKDVFVPGGRTKGGLEELITTPPLCNNVSRSPRRVM